MKNDLISRQAAIETVKKHYRGFDNDLLEVIAYEMERLPSAQPGWIPWDKNTRNSMKYTLQTLYRLAYNIHGVMDAIDDDNVKRLIALLEGGQDESND